MSAASVVMLTTSEIWDRGNMEQEVHLVLTNKGATNGDYHSIGVQVRSSPMPGCTSPYSAAQSGRVYTVNPTPNYVVSLPGAVCKDPVHLERVLQFKM